MIFALMTINIPVLGKATFNIMTLGLRTLSIMTDYSYTQHKVTRH